VKLILVDSEVNVSRTWSLFK